MFIDRLIEKIEEKNNPSVIGLDPLLEYVPKFIKEAKFEEFGKNLIGASKAILEFNKQIIDQIYDIVPVVKLQLACYEMYGIHGMIAFNDTIEYAKLKGLLVIADGKRNDISSSATCYSNAYLGMTKIDDQISEPVFNVDALTVNPYLGIDGIRPFIDDCIKFEKGIFVLVKTSNKSSEEFQDIRSWDCGINTIPLYEKIARKVINWGDQELIVSKKYNYSSVGAVIGATYPEQIKKLRQIMKGIFFLIPGYGTQGGTVQDIITAFDENKIGAIINASRSVMYAYQNSNWKDQFNEKEFAQASRMEALKMKNEINKILNNSYLN